MTNRVIDKVAWLHLEDARILSTRSRGKDAYYLPGGKREPGESGEQCLRREFIWLTYTDRARVAPVDQISFDWLRERGELRERGRASLPCCLRRTRAASRGFT